MAALVTGGLFVTMTLVPCFKYPANPPACRVRRRPRAREPRYS
ncbi:hypothetical protein [Streptomyces sp. NBC_00239]